MPDWHGLTGRDDLVGGRMPTYCERPSDCSHAGLEVCPKCAALTDDEVAALREYFKQRKS